MYYLIYSSYATIEFNDDLLKELLVHARDNNQKLAITGMLYYFDGKFIQLIEGAESTVKQLAVAIENDSRHKYFQILKDGMTSSRHFEDWSMGFKSIDPGKLSDVEKFKELNDSKGQHNSNILHLMKILSS
jgi:hypothetical protein